MKRRIISLMMIAVLLFCLVGCGTESDPSAYPEKSVQIVVGYAAGGDADINARLMAMYLEEELGQTFVVSNVTGASGSTGAAQVRDSDNDGYTMFFSHWGTLLNTLTGTGGVDMFEDFDIVAVPMVDTTSLILVAADAEWDDLAELLDDARANPGTIKFGVETGTMVHLLAAVLEGSNDADLHIVEAGSNAEKLSQLISGQIDMVNMQYSAAKEYIDSGMVKVIASVSAERNENYPEVPTTGELGVEGMGAFEQKFYFFAYPKDTPDEVKEIFIEAVENICSNPDAQAKFLEYYIELDFMDTEESLELIMEAYDTFLPYLDALSS